MDQIFEEKNVNKLLLNENEGKMEVMEDDFYKRLKEDFKKDQKEQGNVEYDIISIDPGYTEQGSVKAHLKATKKDVLVTIKKKDILTSVVIGSKEKKTIDNFNNSISAWFYRFYPMSCQDIARSLILIENQYFNPYDKARITVSHYLGLYESCIYNFFNWKYNSPVLSVSSSAIKRTLGIDCKNRLDNKKAALDFCIKKVIGEEVHNKFEKKITHHEADCINQIYYHVITSFKNRKIKFEII